MRKLEQVYEQAVTERGSYYWSLYLNETIVFGEIYQAYYVDELDNEPKWDLPQLTFPKSLVAVTPLGLAPLEPSNYRYFVTPEKHNELVNWCYAQLKVLNHRVGGWCDTEEKTVVKSLPFDLAGKLA